MDISELRSWAAIMDRAMIASLIATVMAVSALGVTTWLSFRYNGAVREHEQGVEGHSTQLERDVAAARDRVFSLEQEVAKARGQTASLEQEVAAARQRADSFSQAARDASERVVRAERETASANAKEQAAELDAQEIRQRLDALGKQVREATEAPPAPQPAPAEKPADTPASPLVEGLRKYAGTKAAVFVISQVADAPAAGATIASALSGAGWSAETWKWIDVSGIFGVVVLVKDGSDATTTEAAATLVDQLRAAGFSASKGEWPADWRRYRGILDGPQTPDPADAPIRIVIGMKPRAS